MSLVNSVATANQDQTTIFKEQLLSLMDAKDHPVYWHLMGPNATKEQLHLHYLHEWEVYVRDFPLFLARILAKNPPSDVRQDLAENIFEEETGKLTLGVSHPELFLRMMEGLGFDRNAFNKVTLLPAAQKYREWIDEATTSAPWIVGAAVATIFIEGSKKDRAEVEGTKEFEPPVEDKLRQHPLVVHQGLDLKYLDLQRAHSKAESGHRAAAWRMVLGHANSSETRLKVVSALEKSLKLWTAYRDEIMRACGLSPL